MTKQQAQDESVRLFSIGNSDENIEKITKHILEETGMSNFKFKMDARKKGLDADYEYDLMIIASLK
jgi:hypothetical protein